MNCFPVIGWAGGKTQLLSVINERLPKDISNIKALFIRESKLNEELEHQIELLAKDLVRQRKD